MAARMKALAAATAVLFGAGAASAKVYIEIRPRASFVGGFNDNVQLDGKGSDAFGQATPGLKLDLFGDHQLHILVDCQAGIARLASPEKFGGGSGIAGNETCEAQLRDHLSPRLRLRMYARATYAQDPFAIAGLGLLLRPGQNQIFVGYLHNEIAQALSPVSELDYILGTRMLMFGAGDPGNGYLIAPELKYLRHIDARTSWDVGFREQMFIAQGTGPNPLAPKGYEGGLVSNGHAALLGWTRRLTPTAELSLHGGPLLMTGRAGTNLQGVVRGELANVTPTSAIGLAVGHDMAIGATAAGPLVADLAEVNVLGDWEHWLVHGRVGMYRNGTLQQSAVGGLYGYGAEAAVDFKLTKEWRIGVAGLRDARLNDPTVGQLADRDVVQLRLTWERARF